MAMMIMMIRFRLFNDSYDLLLLPLLLLPLLFFPFLLVLAW
jgi:hypothetical protein